MKNKKKNKLVLLILSTLVILTIVVIILSVTTKKDNKEPDVKEVKKVDIIDNYGYYLEEDATDYYKSLYKELKNITNKDEVNYEEYAKIVAKLFVTDVFTLDNKVTSSDVGGLQFIYPDFREDFIKINQTGLYSNVLSNIYNDRVQELPIVNEVNIDLVKETTFNYNNKEYKGYLVELNISYEKDLSYPTTYKLTIIKEDKYLYVAKGE
mgnify:FL=1